MTIKPEALAAMRYVDGVFDGCDNGEWKTIRAELLAMDAEIDRLTKWSEQLSGMKFSDRMHAALKSRAEIAESRLAAADALLRELGEWDLMNTPAAIAIQLDRKIETYLQSEPRP
jgi:hypothetical protein